MTTFNFLSSSVHACEACSVVRQLFCGHEMHELIGKQKSWKPGK